MDSVIFDLDGTIWDPVDTVLHAWNSCIRECSQVKMVLSRADVEQTMGLQMEEISMRLFPDLHKECRNQLIADCFDAELGYLEKQGGMLYPNVRKVLEILAEHCKLCIVSNCQDGYIEFFFKFHNLG
ncbi:HAD family hydrolase [Salisediminibacterium selenitireducens]|uniref:HAD family hydrolase n=1 Tax=Salisediminibacterium selenitireducens TaxID=85683 RepID=UPI002FCDCBA7